jgi:integrase
MAVLQALFTGLRDAGYLAGSPRRAVDQPAAAAMPRAKLNVDRSFSEAEWSFIQAQLDLEEAAARHGPGLPAGAQQRRLRLVLELVAGTGLRLAEITGLCLTDRGRHAGEGKACNALVLLVQGRGGRQRELQVPDQLLALVHAHHGDAKEMGALPDPAPLVCILADAPPRWAAEPDGSVALRRASAGAGRGLSPTGLYRMLKRFFHRVALRAQDVDGLDARRLRAASTHWLRHTFARRSVMARMPMDELQQALGHASPAMTRSYADIG